MRKILIILVAVMLICSWGKAEEPEVTQSPLPSDIYGREDPFAPITARAERPSLKKELGLEGIIWDETQPLAIINGVITTAGQTVDGKKVIRIEKDKVILKENGKEIILPLWTGKKN